MSKFRVEKRRENADVTLITGATLTGSFFLSGSSQSHTGPERVGDLLNVEPGFFPFESRGETSLINRAHVLKVALPSQMIEPQLDKKLSEPICSPGKRRGIFLATSTRTSLSDRSEKFRAHIRR